MEHLHSLRLQSYFLQQFFGLLHPPFRSQISFQEMAVAFLSAGDEYGIGSVFQGFEYMDCVQFPGTH